MQQRAGILFVAHPVLLEDLTLGFGVATREFLQRAGHQGRWQGRRRCRPRICRFCGGRARLPSCRHFRQPAREFLLQRRHRHRFCNVIAHSRRKAQFRIPGECIGGAGDDGHGHACAARVFFRPYCHCEFVAIHDRHLAIGDQQRIAVAAPFFQRFLAVARSVGFEAEEFQLSLYEPQIDDMVLGNQYGFRPGMCGCARTRIERLPPRELRRCLLDCNPVCGGHRKAQA